MVKYICTRKILYEAKYPYLINIHEKVGLKRLNDAKAFIEYSNDMCDVHKNIDGYNVDKDRKIVIVLMILLLILLKIKS